MVIQTNLEDLKSDLLMISFASCNAKGFRSTLGEKMFMTLELFITNSIRKGKLSINVPAHHVPLLSQWYVILLWDLFEKLHSPFLALRSSDNIVQVAADADGLSDCIGKGEPLLFNGVEYQALGARGQQDPAPDGPVDWWWWWWWWWCPFSRRSLS